MLDSIRDEPKTPENVRNCTKFYKVHVVPA